MGKLIGTNTSDNFGEKLFVDKAIEYLDDSCIIYRNRQVYGREFDVCILLPGKGILVVELKGWKEENVLRVEKNEFIVINTSDGEISASPQKQARGYRFALERAIRQNIGKFPLVFQMVCLPQVSKEYYKSLRLDVVLEEKFTILKEDLNSKAAFFDKLDQALREVGNWNRDIFDSRSMHEVRNLFETNIDLKDESQPDNDDADAIVYRDFDYSRFYFVNEHDSLTAAMLKDMIDQYLRGCKLYCVFSKMTQMQLVAKAIDDALTARGLVRNRDNIEFSFTGETHHTPILENGDTAFRGFNFAISLTSSPVSEPSFVVRNGEYNTHQEQLLQKLADVSQFNAEQYFVEHAAPDKNIVIRAGAGTGKTYTMISRIGFICYTQNVPLQTMADRIVMINRLLSSFGCSITASAPNLKK